jgi:hypothetical protein
VTLGLNKHPAHGVVNGQNQITPSGLNESLGKVFDIHLKEPRLKAVEGFVRLLRLVDVANALT